MKIAIASSGLGHVSRGIEAWAADLAAALHAAGVPVTLFSAAPLPSPAVIVPCLKRSDARTARLLRHMPRGMWRLGLGSPYDIEQTTFAWHLIGELRQREIDILHVQDPGVAVLVQRAGRLGIVKTRVILAHGTEEPLSFLKKITYLQHLAPWHMEQAKAAGVHKPTWTAIPNFIDTEIFSPGRPSSLRTELGIPQDAPVVLTVAAIRRTHKRIDYLLSEFAGVLAGHPGAHLVIAGGEESDTGELMREGKEKLGERVHFLVRFPRDRMPELYRNADLFVLCSLKEMMPIAL
ncbi:MAG TPA: glycosyltransferase family 4 protein, partial [Phycisphaerae bacterium]|nr:glycosyltransferase family 4 protein [Phycisphaerae bacterium]